MRRSPTQPVLVPPANAHMGSPTPVGSPSGTGTSSSSLGTLSPSGSRDTFDLSALRRRGSRDEVLPAHSRRAAASVEQRLERLTNAVMRRARHHAALVAKHPELLRACVDRNGLSVFACGAAPIAGRSYLLDLGADLRNASAVPTFRIYLLDSDGRLGATLDPDQLVACHGFEAVEAWLRDALPPAEVGRDTRPSPLGAPSALPPVPEVAPAPVPEPPPSREVAEPAREARRPAPGDAEDSPEQGRKRMFNRVACLRPF